MFRTKTLIRFALVLGICWVVLYIAPGLWPPVNRAYAALFRQVNNVLLMRFWVWPAGKVVFLDLAATDVKAQIEKELPRPLPPEWRAPPAQGVKETLMLLKNRRVPGQIGLLRTSAESLGYWPTALLLGLLIAKPLPWGRKGWAFLWGLVLLHLFIAFRLSLTIAENGFALAEKPYHLFTLTPFWMARLSNAVDVFVHNPTVSFVIPVLIWFIVAFTKQDWAQFRDWNEARADGTVASS